MNIIWLTPEPPFPPVGGRNGVYNRILQLSKYNNIFLFSIVYNSQEELEIKEMEKYCKEVNTYNRNANVFKKYFKSIFKPYSVASRTIKKMQLDILSLCDRVDIDVIIVDFPNMALNIRKIQKKYPNIVLTLNQHNIEYKRMREMFNVKTINFVKRISYYLESFRLERYEKRIYKKINFKAITFFSVDDAKFFEKRWSKIDTTIEVFPLGANLLGDLNCSKENEYNILFIGRLDNLAIPNVEASVWFAKDIFPFVKNKVPKAKFIIAGANPSDVVYNLSSNDITIIPNYKSLKEVYSLANVVVLPLLSGGGVKGKLLEAASANKFIVSTSRGVEGTTFEDEKDLIVSDDAKEFADKLSNILLSQNEYSDMRNNAFKKFCECYQWDKICQNYHIFLTKLKEGINENK